MPYFRFFIHGKGKMTNDITGFFTTRWSEADDAAHATAKVLEALTKEWSRGEYHAMCGGKLPSFEIEEASEITRAQTKDIANRGYTFYDKE